MTDTLQANSKAAILVVDDERTVCESVEKVLSRFGHRVTQETSVPAAVARLDAGARFDLVVVDLMMPRVGGAELVKVLRERWPDVAILVITGFASITSAVESARLGAVGYLPKPFTPDELAKAVDAAIAAKSGEVLRFQQLPPAGPIDVDVPFDAREVARATSAEYANRLTRSDLPLVETKPPVPAPDYCALGQRSCKRFVKKGMCKQPECPIVASERKKAAQAQGVAALVSDPIDVDMPFSASELAAVTSDAYVGALGRSDLPITGYWSAASEAAPRVLVVDDEPVVLNSVRKTLVRRGYVVDESFTGREALARFSGDPYQLVLLDLRLPDINGLDLLAKIKREHPNVPVVIVTGYASIESAVEAIQRGASDYLPKPFTPEELYVVAERALEESAA
jgi:DNA-binding response OmpR family regulator